MSSRPVVPSVISRESVQAWWVNPHRPTTLFDREQEQLLVLPGDRTAAEPERGAYQVPVRTFRIRPKLVRAEGTTDRNEVRLVGHANTDFVNLFEMVSHLDQRYLPISVYAPEELSNRRLGSVLLAKGLLRSAYGSVLHGGSAVATPVEEAIAFAYKFENSVLVSRPGRQPSLLVVRPLADQTQLHRAEVLVYSGRLDSQAAREGIRVIDWGRSATTMSIGTINLLTDTARLDLFRADVADLSSIQEVGGRRQTTIDDQMAIEFVRWQFSGHLLTPSQSLA